MATKHHNLSHLEAPLPSAADMKFGIVVAEWNREVTEALLEGAVQTLRSAGCPDLNIQIKYVPGTFELTLGAQFFAEYSDVDAVIALGCVVQGETRHFDFICQGVTQGITQLQIQWNMPIAFGILHVHEQPPADDRAGG
ncbi:MAG: 6,7-dimethyl-8-ribityllumazine synthase, partial [Alistipes sp.]|nr:6,7-dimethyl-8-ribityllumazine synthase [Alistipes sp.]